MRLVDSNNVIDSLDGVHNATLIVSVMEKHIGVFKHNVEYPLYLTTGYIPHFRKNFIIGKVYVTIDKMLVSRITALREYRALCSVRKDFSGKGYSDVIRMVRPFSSEKILDSVKNFINDVTVYGYQYNIHFRMPYDDFCAVDFTHENASDMRDGFFIW